jgi:hypothetical protein
MDESDFLSSLSREKNYTPPPSIFFGQCHDYLRKCRCDSAAGAPDINAGLTQDGML